MILHIARRVMLFIPAWLIMGIIAFTLIRLIPGDPAAILLGPDASPDAVARLREQVRDRVGTRIRWYTEVEEVER